MKKMAVVSKSRMKRAIYEMPAFISEAMRKRGLEDAYRVRPPYQRNDYVGWITRAKQESTQQKRLAQMLDELAGGELYMNMPYKAKHAATDT